MSYLKQNPLDDYGHWQADRDCQLVALDIETTGLKPFRDEIVVIAVHYQGAEEPYVYDVRRNDPVNIQDWLRTLFKEKTIVAHNGAFDFSFIEEKYQVGYPQKLIWDTMLAERLLTAGLLSMRSSLKEVAERRMGVLLDKSQQVGWNMEDELTPEQIEYAGFDVFLLIDIAMQQRQDLARHGLAQVWEIERKAIPVFAEMDRAGIKVDEPGLRELLRKKGIQAEEVQRDLQQKLTHALYASRIEAFEEALEARRRYAKKQEEKQAHLEQQWSDLIDMSMRGFGGSHDSLSPEELDTDRYPDGRVKGQARYAKARLSEWKQRNPLPPVAKMDASLLNPRSNQQVLTAFKEVGIELPDLKNETVNAAALEHSKEIVETYLDPLLEYKKLAKLISSFGEPLLDNLDDRQRLHGSSWQIGTATGRPSKSDPNLYQMPKTDEFRSLFIPDEGYLFAIFDYSQMELRIVAEMSQDPELLRAFREGLDIHRMTAAQAFFDGTDAWAQEQVTDDQRKAGKITNFGILYGMYAKRHRMQMAKDRIYISHEDSEMAINGWRRLFSNAAMWIAEQGRLALRQGYTESILGRKRFFDLSKAQERWEKGAIERRGANHPIQGGNADITKIALGNLFPKLQKYGARIVTQVYDEIVVEAPYETVYEVAVLVRQEMLAAAKEVLKEVPVEVDGGIGMSWSESGRLSPERFIEKAMAA